MSIFGFFKKKKLRSTFSEHNHWERRSDYNQPTRLLHDNHEYTKLDKKGMIAKKGVRENIYRQGTVSVLKRYFDDKSNESILVKTFKADNIKYIDDREPIERAREEAEKMLSFGVAYDYIERTRKKTGAAIDIIMPYYGKNDLFDIADQFQNEKNHSHHQIIQLFQYALSAMLALQDAHDRGWIHFDVKLENFLVDEKNNIVRLIDPEFAMRKELISKIKANKIGMTPEYAAPEMFSNSYLENGEAADVCSMGFTLAAFFAIVKENSVRFNKKVQFYFDPDDKEYSLKILMSSLNLSKGQANIIFSLICNMTCSDPNQRISLNEARQTFESVILALEENVLSERNIEINLESAIAPSFSYKKN